MPYWLRTVFNWLILGSLALAGLTFLGVGGSALYQAAQSETWPVTEGLIITTEVASAADGTPLRQVHSVYEYEIDGKTYTGDSHAFGETDFPSVEAAEQRAKEFPAGTPVDVYHHPEKHGRSTLTPGTGTHLYRLPLTGLSLLVIGIPAAFFALRAAEKKALRRVRGEPRRTAPELPRSG